MAQTSAFRRLQKCESNEICTIRKFDNFLGGNVNVIVRAIEREFAKV